MFMSVLVRESIQHKSVHLFKSKFVLWGSCVLSCCRQSPQTVHRTIFGPPRTLPYRPWSLTLLTVYTRNPAPDPSCKWRRGGGTIHSCYQYGQSGETAFKVDHLYKWGGRYSLGIVILYSMTVPREYLPPQKNTVHPIKHDWGLLLTLCRTLWKFHFLS